MQLDVLDAAAIGLSIVVLIIAVAFIGTIWAAALGHPVF